MTEKNFKSQLFRNTAAALLIGFGLLCIIGTGGGGDGLRLPSQHRISGTVRAPDNMLVDSDVNDPGALYASNDDVNNAQILTNPAVVGGYVNIAGTGEPGRSYIDGDPKDIYRVTLAAHQTVTMVAAARCPPWAFSVRSF